MKKYKRGLAFLLTLMLVLTFIPVQPVQALAPGVEVSSTSTHNGSSTALTLTDGAIWTDKEVEVVDAQNGIFDITLKAVGQQYKMKPSENPNPIDVVLVLDVSRSMEGNKLTSLKKAATSAAVILLGIPNNRLAVVKYSDTASLVSLGGADGFTTSSSIASGKIKDIELGTYTNIQDGLFVAHNLIKNRTDKSRKPIIILMSDGEPNRYYTSLDTHTNQGSGNNIKNSSQGTTADANSIWWTIQQGMYTRTNNTPTEDDDIDIYTIGFDIGTNNRAKATLAPTAANTASYRPNGTNFNHKYWIKSSLDNNSLDSILKAFEDLANQLTTFAPTQSVAPGSTTYSSVEITDVIGEGFEAVLPLPEGVALNGNTLTWTIPGSELMTMPAGNTSKPVLSQMSTVKIKVKVNDTVREGIYQTNSLTTGANFATFTVPAANPAYKGQNTPIIQNLLNYGEVELCAPDIAARIDITKIVTAPAGYTGSNTFKFNLYYNAEGTGTPINGTTPIAITVNGIDQQTVSQYVTLQGIQLSDGEETVYVREVTANAPANWCYDSAVKEARITRAATTSAVSFTNNYAPVGTLTVNKSWTGLTGGAVKFILKKAIEFGPDGTTPIAWQNVSDVQHQIAGPSWSTTVTNLDINDVYSVEEVREGTELQDYTTTYGPLYVSFTADNPAAEITICNTYNTPTGKITINKEWNHNGNEDTDRPKSIRFEYTGPNDQTKILTLQANDTTGQWSNFIEPTVFGTYTFKELVPQDYTAVATEQSITITSDTMEGRVKELTFVNNYVTPSGTVAITKTWTDETNGNTTYRPDSLTVRLQKWLGINEETGEDQWEQAKDLSGDDAVAIVQKVQFSNTTNMIYTFNNLAWGKYRVQEDNVKDYTASYSDPVTLSKYASDGTVKSRNGGIEVTNSFNNPKASILVTKTWVESEDIDYSAVRPGEITIKLLDSEGAVIDSVTTAGSICDWSHTFLVDLPAAGQEATYTVLETADDAAKLAHYDINYKYGSGTVNEITINRENRYGSVAVTNTYAKGTITVIKKWVDMNNPVSERPGGVYVTLWKQVSSMVAEVEQDSEQLTATVAEGDAGGGGSAPGTGSTPVGNPVYTVRTDTEVVDGIEITGSEPIVFYNLELGSNISYYVTESETPYYSAITEYFNDKADSPNEDKSLVLVDNAGTENDNLNGQVVITNTYDDPKGSLTVEKKWNHGYNLDRPESITLRLFSGDREIDSVEVTANNNWKHTFSGLTLGAVYTVSEDLVPGYATTFGQTTSYQPVKGATEVENGSITITNTYQPATGDLKIVKKWVEKTGGDVGIVLTRYSGSEHDSDFRRTVTLSAISGWEYTFEGLELYGPNGLYSYHADECGNFDLFSVENNDTPTLTAGGIKTITITNTYTPEEKGTLIITKAWLSEHGIAMDPTVTSVAVRLYIDDKPEALAMVLSDDNNWTVVRSGLNAAKAYRVEEVTDLEEFDVSYSADSITFDSGSLTKTLTVTNKKNADQPELGLEKVIEKSNKLLTDGSATFTYTVDLYNNGNRTLTDLYVIDKMTVPEGAKVTYSPAPTEIYSDGSVKFAVADKLTPRDAAKEGQESNGKIPFTYTVTVDKAGEYDNIAVAHGSYKGQDVASGEANANGIVKLPGLNITKEVIGTSSSTTGGETFAYKLTIVNNGEFTLSDVKIEDVMTTTNSAATIKYNGSSDMFNIGVLPNDGVAKIITYTVTVNGVGEYNNTATVTGEYQDEVYGSGTMSASDDDSVKVTYVRDDDDDDDDDDNGGGGGGGGSTPTPTTPIDDEAVPQGPVPDVIKEETIINDAIPAGPLPKTGGVAPIFFFGAGALLAGGGLFLRRKSKTNLAEKHIEE